MRTYLKALQPSARRTFIDVELNRASGEVTGFDLQNLEDTKAPLILKLDYILKRQFHPAGNQLVGKLPDVWEQIYASAVPVGTPGDAVWTEGFPIDVESKITVATPEGFQEPAPENFRQNLQMAFGTSQSEARNEKSGLKIDYKLQRRAGTFAATDYSPYQESMVKALEPLEQTVAFTKRP